MVTIDGNLSDGEKTGAEGAYFAGKIREKYPDIKLVGLGGEKIPGVDLDTTKLDEIQVVIDGITAL